MAEIYLTKERIEELKKEAQELQSKIIPEIADHINRAKELGDLSENFEYHEAKERMAFSMGRVREIEHMLVHAVVYEAGAGGDSVRLGSRFTVVKEGKEKEFVIVGADEAKPLEGKISNDSPMGSAFLGKRVGDTVSVTAPKGALSYTITAIH